jgi:hypothetical protein
MLRAFPRKSSKGQWDGVSSETSPKSRTDPAKKLGMPEQLQPQIKS